MMRCFITSRAAHVLNMYFVFFSSDASDSDDDTAELLRELEKIKRERAEEKERAERERLEREQEEREKEIAMGNPLLPVSGSVATSSASDFTVKRRYTNCVHYFLRLLMHFIHVLGGTTMSCSRARRVVWTMARPRSAL